MHPQKEKHRGVEQLVARQAHNLEVARSNPASATSKQPERVAFFVMTGQKKKAQVVVRLLALFKLE